MSLGFLSQINRTFSLVKLSLVYLSGRWSRWATEILCISALTWSSFSFISWVWVLYLCLAAVLLGFGQWCWLFFWGPLGLTSEETWPVRHHSESITYGNLIIWLHDKMWLIYSVWCPQLFIWCTCTKDWKPHNINHQLSFMHQIDSIPHHWFFRTYEMVL